VKALSLWAPVVALFALILSTLPLGPTFGLILKRLGASTAEQTVELPSAGVELDTSSGVTAVRLSDDRLAIYSEDALHLSDIRCLGVDVTAGEVLCAGGFAGLLRVDPTGALVQALPMRGAATRVARAGRVVIVGTAAGELQLFTVDDGVFRSSGRVPSIAQDIVSLFPVDGAVIVADADGDIIGVSVSDPAEPVVVGTSRITDIIYDLVTFGNTGMLAAGTDGVVVFDISDLGNAVELNRYPIGDVRDVHVSHGNLTWGVVPGHGAQALLHTRIGPILTQRSHGVEDRLHAISGRPPLQPGLAGDSLLIIDAQPSADRLIVGVGALALIGMAALIGPFLYRREEGWHAKLLWIGLGVLGLGWLLAARTHNPIEALHILEYGALGALLVRAVRPLGGGLSGGLLVVAVATCAALTDETVQFLLPTRSGDLDDVWLDLQAAAVGTIVGVQVWTAEKRASWSWSAYVGAALVCSIGLFQHVTVGYGHAHTLGDTTFSSRLEVDEIRAQDRDNGSKYARILERTAAMGYGIFLAEFPARAEPFLYELRVHLYRRDRRLEKGDVEVACGEERLLQQLFRTSYAGTSWEWPGETTLRCAPFVDAPYHSPVSGEIMTTTSPFRLWLGVILGALFFVGMGVRFRQRDDA
jgi:hypothetical protein